LKGFCDKTKCRIWFVILTETCAKDVEGLPAFAKQARRQAGLALLPPSSLRQKAGTGH
jgi:hypothetical protein